MASRLNPYISFDGNAREAMDFYKSVVGGSLEPTPLASPAHRTPRTPTRSCTAFWKPTTDSRSCVPTRLPGWSTTQGTTSR